MKPISVLAVASIAVLAATSACKKDEPKTGETTTTGAQVTPEAPATEPVKPLPVEPQVQPQGQQTTTGSATDSTTSNQSGMRQTINKGKDAGAASDFPTGGNDLMDHDRQHDKNMNQNPSGQPQSSVKGKEQGADHNKSTTLGNGKSGEYTGGKGTYGGKETWGTGPKKDTQMDQQQQKDQKKDQQQK